MIDGNADLLRIRAVGRSAVVGHGQPGGVNARLIEGPGNVGADHRLTQIAEVPAGDGDPAVRIEGIGGAQMNRITGRGDEVAAWIGDRRSIDGYSHFLAVVGTRFASVVLNGQPHWID